MTCVCVRARVLCRSWLLRVRSLPPSLLFPFCFPPNPLSQLPSLSCTFSRPHSVSLILAHSLSYSLPPSLLPSSLPPSCLSDSSPPPLPLPPSCPGTVTKTRVTDRGPLNISHPRSPSLTHIGTLTMHARDRWWQQACYRAQRTVFCPKLRYYAYCIISMGLPAASWRQNV